MRNNTKNTLLEEHFERLRENLLNDFELSNSYGHTVNKGTAREIFIKNFLSTHLAQTVEVGSGEIIDSNSKRNEVRNQLDIIIYRKEFPRINIATNCNIFLAESVISVIEIKSNLTKNELRKTLESSRNIKKYKIPSPQISRGVPPDKIPFFIVAYKGPTIMTVHKWLMEEKPNYIDGIFIIEKGSITLEPKVCDGNNDHIKYKLLELKEANPLLKIFLILTNEISQFRVYDDITARYTADK